jgi:hypothetical protein
LDHHRADLLTKEDDAHQVQIEHPSPTVRTNLEEWPIEDGPAGVVDKDVDRSERFERRRDRCLDLVGLHYVTNDDLGNAIQCPYRDRDIFERGPRAPEHGDIGTGFGERDGDRTTDAPTRAGYKRNTVKQDRGNGGNGTWKVELAGEGEVISSTTLCSGRGCRSRCVSTSSSI